MYLVLRLKDGQLNLKSEEEEAPGLAVLMGEDLGSDDEDDNYDSNEEPEGN